VGALDRFRARHGRPVKLVALDFGDQYWGDIGQHRQIHDLYLALRDRGPAGEVARAVAGLDGEFDADGNLLVGETRLGPGVRVRDSVLVDARIDAGEIHGSVLLGTRCGTLLARDAFDLHSTAMALELAPRAGSYKVVTDVAVSVGPGERVATVLLPDGEHLLRVHEDTDLRDRARTYDQPILENPVSFAAAHAAVTAADPAELELRRTRRRQEVAAKLGDG
jgi:multidrug efflux pump subunit AcrA (membrane-fusion protein)